MARHSRCWRAQVNTRRGGCERSVRARERGEHGRPDDGVPVAARPLEQRPARPGPAPPAPRRRPGGGARTRRPAPAPARPRWPGAWPGGCRATRAAANVAAPASRGEPSAAAAAMRAGVTRSSPSLTSTRSAAARVSASASSSSTASLSARGATISRVAAAASGDSAAVGFGRQRAERRAVGAAVERGERFAAHVAPARERVGEQLLQLARVRAPQRRQIRGGAPAGRPAARRRRCASPPAGGPRRARSADACHAASACSGTAGVREREPARQQRARQQRGAARAARATTPGSARPPAPAPRRRRRAGPAAPGIALCRSAARTRGHAAEARRSRPAGQSSGGARPPRPHATHRRAVGAGLAAETEAGGRDHIGLPIIQRLDQVGRGARVVEAAEAPQRGGAQADVAGGRRPALQRDAAARVAQAGQRDDGGQLQFGVRAPAAASARRCAEFRRRGRARGSRCRASAGAASPLPSMPMSSIALRSGVCSLSVMISSSGRRTPRPMRVARFVRGRVAVQRGQHPLEHGDQRPAARGRVLPRGRRLRQPLLRGRAGGPASRPDRSPAVPPP